MGIGTQLAHLLHTKGMKPGTLAREAGVSKNTVYSIIKRDNDKVDRVILEKLARALRVPVSAFYGESSLPLPDHPAILPIEKRAVPLLGSIAGTLLTGYLVNLGSFALMTPLAVLVFLMLWVAPVLLLSAWAGRF